MAELDEILASAHFSNSRRYPALLRYIVENTLAGRTEVLKERTLGVEVFQRPPTYDTNIDTVVRYTAGEVRKRLQLYYSEHDSRTGIHISLPSGSYLPEFLRNGQGPEMDELPAHGSPDGHGRHGDLFADNHAAEPELPGMEPVPAHLPEAPPALTLPPSKSGKWAGTLAVGGLIAVLALAVAAWRWAGPGRTSHAVSPVDEFWAPIEHDSRPVIICAGSVVFAQDKYSGVTTADNSTDYPFFSMQTTAAIAQVNGMIERNGATAQLLSASSAQLTQLREHSVALLGAYSNQWTLRLTDLLRYHFAPGAERIIDVQRPQLSWRRDESVPYSGADDYALVARFREAQIDGWVVALAGIGRNGTEAAAQFATSPHYLELLRQRLGGSFGNRNVEALLKVSVIKGETGAPEILEAYAW
jgi:hypothetical protein